MTNTQHKKATFYMADLWGYDRVEVNNATWRFEKYAQYPSAARIEYTVSGKRKRQTAMITTQPLIVLDGWGHPDPPKKLTPPKVAKGYTTQSTRRLSCDPEWECEFDAFLYGYLAGSKTKVLMDFRKHDPTKPSK